MDRFDAMAAFAQVVATGSFARAAERLGVSTSSLSRLVAGLERHLGVRLLNRTTRRLALTDEGQAFYERCVQLLADLAEAEALAGAAGAPRGTLRLTCPHNLVEDPLAPAIARFASRWPEVSLEVTVSDQVVDLIDAGLDLAIRIGSPGAGRFVARRLGATRLVCAAAPALARRLRRLRSPAELAAAPVLTYANVAQPRLWRLIDAAGATHEVRVQGRIHANSGTLLVAAAIDGAGVVFEPDFVLAAPLADGRLVRLLPAFGGPLLEIWAVYPGRRHLSAKVRRFVEEVAAAFAGRFEPSAVGGPAG